MPEETITERVALDEADSTAVAGSMPFSRASTYSAAPICVPSSRAETWAARRVAWAWDAPLLTAAL